jgi:hypothetical protein
LDVWWLAPPPLSELFDEPPHAATASPITAIATGSRSRRKMNLLGDTRIEELSLGDTPILPSTIAESGERDVKRG